jgi:hypothetical protein
MVQGETDAQPNVYHPCAQNPETKPLLPQLGMENAINFL